MNIISDNLHDAHEYMRLAADGLITVCNFSHDEFSQPILDEIVREHGDLMKKLTILESYHMFKENGFAGAAYDGVFEEVYRIYKKSKGA